MTLGLPRYPSTLDIPSPDPSDWERPHITIGLHPSFWDKVSSIAIRNSESLPASESSNIALATHQEIMMTDDSESEEVPADATDHPTTTTTPNPSASVSIPSTPSQATSLSTGFQPNPLPVAERALACPDHSPPAPL